MRPLFTLLLAASLGGCTLVFGVDPDQWASRDAGMDAPDVDPDAGDGGEEDAGDADRPDAPDGGPPCATVERVCDPGTPDEDCDGTSNCNDIDCATDLACCGSETNVVDEGFVGGTPAGWPWIPSELMSSPSQGASPQDINNFGIGDPRALMLPTCVPIDLGVRISVRFDVEPGTPSCPTGEPDCDNYASLVLSAREDAALGESLSDELSIRVYDDGRTELRSANTVLERRPTNFGVNPITLTLELTPGVREDNGLAYVFATVVMDDLESTWSPWTMEPVIDRGYLVGAQLGCDVARGLFLGLEGTGNRVRMDNLRVDRFGCANPAHFEAVGSVGREIQGDDLDGTLVSTDNDYWTHGGIGSPSIQSFFTMPSAPSSDRWELFYDASNRERTLEPRDAVRHAIGGSYTVDDRGIASYVPRGTAGAPLVGLDPPDCIGMQMPVEGCSALRGSREPSLFVPIHSTMRHRLPGAQGILVYAREIPGMTGRYDIWGTRVEPVVDVAVDDGMAILTAADADCDSVRDPVLIPTRPDSTADLYLLFRCEEAGEPSTIRAAHFDDYPDPTPDVLPGAIVSPMLLGSFARNGVRAPDAAVWYTTGGQVLVRLWFVGDDALTAPSVGYAEGIGPAGSLPVMRMYPANPVLRSDDPILGECPEDGCDIESLAVTRLALDPARIRMLVSRTPEVDTTIDHVFVPLEQRWPAL